jgi:hypothetical protein
VEFSSGAGGGGTLAVDDEGTEVASAATRLNFTGAGVVATDAGSGVVDVTISGGGGSGTGDMLAAVYDPNTVEGDAFDMANMVEATDAKVMSAAERTKLAGIEAGAEVNDVASVNGQTGTVVLDPDDLDDTATANKFTTASDISKLAGIETGATADQSDAEIETAYNNQVSVVSQAEAEAGTATTVRRWTAERVAQAIAALASGGGDMFASVYDPNAIAGDAFDMANMVEAADAKVMSAAERTKLAGVEAGAEVNDVASVNGQTGTVVLDPDDLDDTATANKFTTASDISKLAGIETGATADQTGAEIAAAIDITGATEAGSFASGDKLLAYIDGVGNRQIDYDDLPAGGGGGGIAGDGVTDIVALTQSAYDALTPDSQTLYIITG